MKLPEVKLGHLVLKVPIIQGGMGVGISLSSLAGAVAREGGMGVISAAQPGFSDPLWKQNPLAANLNALSMHIKKAKELSNGGVIGVNIMRALRNYDDYVRCCVKSGADAIISGAGLPKELPELLEGSQVKFAPIVSSLKAIRVLFRFWQKRYGRLSDFVVIEGPKAGGHLGFSAEEARTLTDEDYDREVKQIIDYVHAQKNETGDPIPVFFAGGIYDRQDIDHYLALGADGVQIATRFVTTVECDAPMSFKQSYLNAGRDDITIVKSPVGMPGRAISNQFVRERSISKERIDHCFGCLAACNPKSAPYCITQALIRAATEGHTEDALIFCGTNVDRLHRLETVHDIFAELTA